MQGSQGASVGKGDVVEAVVVGGGAGVVGVGVGFGGGLGAGPSPPPQPFNTTVTEATKAAHACLDMIPVRTC